MFFQMRSPFSLRFSTLRFLSNLSRSPFLPFTSIITGSCFPSGIFSNTFMSGRLPPFPPVLLSALFRDSSISEFMLSVFAKCLTQYLSSCFFAKSSIFSSMLFAFISALRCLAFGIYRISDFTHGHKERGL